MGDKMALSFKGTTVEVERSAEGAMKAVTAFGQMDGIAGSMSGQMETLGGKVSNLGDAFNSLLVTLGDSQGWSNAIGNLTSITKWVDGLINGGSEDESWFEYKLMKGIKDLPTEDLKKALEDKLAEVNGMANSIQAEYEARMEKSFFGKLWERDFNKAWIKENEALITDYQITAEIIQQKLDEINNPKKKGDLTPLPGLLSTLRDKLKKLNEEAEAAPTEKILLDKQAEIVKTKEQIRAYEDLYEAKLALDKLNEYNAKFGGKTKTVEYAPDGAKPDKITGFAAQNIANTKEAQEAVDKIRQDNVSSYKKMTDSIALLDKTYHDAAIIKDEAYHKEKNKIVGDFLQEAMGNVNQLADIIGGLDQEAGQMISNLGGAMVGLFSANPITQMLSAVQLVMQLGVEFGKAINRGLDFEVEISAINKTLEDTTKLLSHLSSNNGFSYYKEYADAQMVIDNSIVAREKKLAEHEKGLKKEIGRAYQSPFINSDKRIKEYRELIAADKEALEQLRLNKIEAEKEFNETITQTTIVSLSDAIIDGFKRGESETEIFANNFKRLMMDAVGEALKRKTFDKLSEEGGFYDTFTEAMGNDGFLSPEETAKLDDLYAAAINYGKVLWDGANEWAANYPDADLGGASSMTGTIKGITEETGSKLEGSFNAVRISLIEQKTIAMQGYNQLVMIENNTRPISEIRDILKGGSTSGLVKNRAYGK